MLQRHLSTCPPAISHTWLLTAHSTESRESFPCTSSGPPSLHPSSSDEAGSLMGWSQVTHIHPSKSRNPLHCAASMTVNKGCCHFPEGRAGESAWPSIKPSCRRNCWLTSEPVLSVLGRAGLYSPASFQSLVRSCNWVPANRS